MKEAHNVSSTFLPHRLVSMSYSRCTTDAMGLVSALVVEQELEDARAREKAGVAAADCNPIGDGPYKAEV